jgi:FKBP-type peptidyl-prolyl cis-trans isomerase
MKCIAISLTAALLAVACKPKQEEPQKVTAAPAQASAADVTKESLKTDLDKVNYAVGVEIGKNIVRNGLEFEKPIFMKGIEDGMADKEFLLDEKERQDVKRAHAKAQRELREQKRKEEGEKNKKDGEKFLTENKTKEGVVTLESGLQYIVLKEGSGEKPAAEDTVSVHYVGTLMDGTEFDSSVKRGKPSTFKVNRVVKGWTEALQLMPVGSKWKLFIPSELGYGERGSHGKIGPNAVLIFEVELLEIKKEEDKPKPPFGPGAKPIKPGAPKKNKPAEAKPDKKK